MRTGKQDKEGDKFLVTQNVKFKQWTCSTIERCWKRQKRSV